jgi:hypothetical protein
VIKVVAVPKGIDFENLFESFSVAQLRTKARLKDKIYYFLSKVVTHDGNIHLYEKNEGFRRIPMSQMDEILGSRDSRAILKMLTQKTNPIIEVKPSYRVGKYSKGYRLTSKYRTGEIEFKSLKKEISEKILLIEKKDPTLPNYEFLIEQFSKHRIDFTSEFMDYTIAVGKNLIGRSENKYQKQIIFNKIGRYLKYLEEMNAGRFHISHSKKNHRFSSILTWILKESRNFIKISGQTMVEVDLSSSQPYILASILKDILKTEESFIQEESTTRTSFSILNYIKESENDLLRRMYPFMLRTFSEMSREQKDSIRYFTQIPFDKDFYAWTQDQSSQRVKRNEVKGAILFFLFDDDKGHRNNNQILKELAGLFHGVNHFIEMMLRLVGKSDFARFLQMIESHILINILLRSFHSLYPKIPLFTIHDAILTTDEFAPLLKKYLDEELQNLTSITPKSKISFPVPLKDVVESSILKEWKKISKVDSKRKFKKLSYAIYPKNIQRGIEILGFGAV